MKEGEKICLTTFILSAVFISIICLGTATQGWAYYEETVKFWLPEKYVLTNEIAGKYIDSPGFTPSGSLTHLLFPEYKSSFNESKITVTTKGEVYYEHVENGSKYLTSIRLTSSDGDYPTSAHLLDGKNVRLVFDARFFLLFIGGLVSVVGSVFLSFPAIWLSAYTKKKIFRN